MIIKKPNSKELFIVLILGYLVFQIAWIFLWSIILFITFPGDRLSGGSFFAWSSEWGFVVGDLLFALHIILIGIIVYLFTRSLKITFILTVVMLLIFTIGAALFGNGVYFTDLIKHVKYALLVS